jgi:uroporphyrin-III C-methyltransferase
MNDALAALLRNMPTLPAGHVWLAGAGPGDPGLLTLHALSALAQADVVVHDALVDGRILALARPDAEMVFAGKRGGRPSVDQADIAATLVTLARAGRKVLRLKGGDPYVFGRGGEEALALAEAGIPFRTIPGITAGIGGLAAALIPATQRGVNQAFVLATGHGAEHPDATEGEIAGALDWAALARLGQPLVLYMAVTHVAAIAHALLAGGMAPQTPAAVVSSATTPDQRVVVATLATLPDDLARERLATPAIVVIGEIVAMRARLLALLPDLEREGFWLAG